MGERQITDDMLRAAILRLAPGLIEMVEHDPQRDVWECRVGQIDRSKLPKGADLPMRDAVAEAYHKLTGEYPPHIFSGWGARFTEGEQAIADNRALPHDHYAAWEIVRDFLYPDAEGAGHEENKNHG